MRQKDRKILRQPGVVTWWDPVSKENRAGDNIQWKSICLTCMGPWVQLPALQPTTKKSHFNSKLQFEEFKIFKKGGVNGWFLNILQ